MTATSAAVPCFLYQGGGQKPALKKEKGKKE
jgi:hypothetical protein